VVTTVSGAEKADLARAAGADLVVNYREPDVLERIRAYTERVDRVVEVNLAVNLALDLGLSGPGTVVAVYAADTADPELPVRACMSANVVLRFVLLYGVPVAELLLGVREVGAALEAGALTELPVHRFRLEECAAAQEAVQAGAVGKVLLDVG
jgi:NADPH2:quinone reductase